MKTTGENNSNTQYAGNIWGAKSNLRAPRCLVFTDLVRPPACESHGADDSRVSGAEKTEGPNVHGNADLFYKKRLAACGSLMEQVQRATRGESVPVADECPSNQLKEREREKQREERERRSNRKEPMRVHGEGIRKACPPNSGDVTYFG
ncbi:hypothetical protein EYF80_005023 [Liparis tanakae]|uniref:Uncharacterized protein n=1 Tax=Liparis tanakae TaxID=230148 RepID=A0A4Z2J4J1_9TELE|nr:hypothetical protein EYF80_005023 [Liparis tanakae]